MTKRAIAQLRPAAGRAAEKKRRASLCFAPPPASAQSLRLSSVSSNTTQGRRRSPSAGARALTRTRPEANGKGTKIVQRREKPRRPRSPRQGAKTASRRENRVRARKPRQGAKTAQGARKPAAPNSAPLANPQTPTTPTTFPRPPARRPAGSGHGNEGLSSLTQAASTASAALLWLRFYTPATRRRMGRAGLGRVGPGRAGPDGGPGR